MRAWTWLKKQLGAMKHPGTSGIFGLLPRTNFDYRKEVGRGFGSSVVMAPVKFVQRVFPEAPLMVRRRNATNPNEEIIDPHPMTELVRRPNPFYSGNALWRSTVGSWILDGNAYWIKRFDNFGMPRELWWTPPWMMVPKWPEDGSQFISHYEYTVAGESVDLPVESVCHFRNGLDPRNARLGMSDLHSVLREVFSDDEASNFTASILRNSGVPGVVISPKEGPVDADEAKAAEARFSQKFGGDRRGAAMAMRSPTEVHQFAWSPAQLELGSLRDVSEERVCAVIGLPAAVVGFGAGLQQTKVGATMRELIQLAWIACIIPMQNALGQDLDMQLLPSFAGATDRAEVSSFFDSTAVAALQENEKERADRLNVGVGGAGSRSPRRGGPSGFRLWNPTRFILSAGNRSRIGANSQEGATMQVRKKQFRLKAVDGDEGKVTAVIATLNVKDHDGDVTLPGAFGEQTVPVVPVHDWWAVPIGKASISEKEDRVLAAIDFNLEVSSGRDWFSAVKFDFDPGPPLQEYSYGFRIDEDGSELGQHEGEDVNFLKSLKVIEVSPVLKGAGIATGTLDVKGLTMEAQADAALAAADDWLERCKALAALREKEGRTLSTANRERLQKLVTALADVRADLNELLAATDVIEEDDKALGAFMELQSRMIAGGF